MRNARTRVLLFGACLSLAALTACVDTLTSPLPAGKRAMKDTTVIDGDSTLCRSGYTIIGGRIVCNSEQ